MKRQMLAVACVTGLVAASLGCQSAITGPELSTSASPDAVAALGPGGSSLKAAAPVPVSPINNPTVSSLTPTLTITGGALTYSTGAPQYRYRIMDAVGAVTVDSGLQTAASWTPAAPLTPTSVYTWMARSETRGLTGPWSTTGRFTTPVAPGNDYGAWESTCQGRTGEPLVVCVWNFVRPTNSFEVFEVTKRVAWLLRASGGGLLLKGSGENVVPWMGINYSASRICFPDGHIFKLFTDVGPGGANLPIYSDNNFAPVTDYVPAKDPRLR